MSEESTRFALSQECQRINALLTDADRATISAGKKGKPGDWIIEAIKAPSRFSRKSVQVAINVCDRHLARRAKPARKAVPRRPVLNAATRELALRAAIAEVRTYDDREVRRIARTTLRDITPQAVLEPEVARRLLADSVDTQRQGLVLFAVDNDGLRLAQKQQQSDDIAAFRKARDASQLEKHAAFMSLIARVGASSRA